MGAIIGTAIGSVIGMSVAPDEGKKTRKILKKGKGRLSEHKDDIDEIKQLTKETMIGLGSLAKNIVFGKKDAPSTEEVPRTQQGMKKIPRENSAEINIQE